MIGLTKRSRISGHERILGARTVPAWRLFRAGILAFFLTILPLSIAAETLRVHFIDVGQGHATLLETSSATVLVDAGQYGAAPEYLSAQDVDRIDLAIATHGHADHIGGFPEILARTRVERIWYNGQTHTSRTFERFLDAVLASSAKYHEPSRGERLRLGDLEITVLHPEGSAADYRGHLHDKNIVVRVVYREFSLVLPGDAETSAEQTIIRAHEAGHLGETIRSTVLQLGHHGSYTSSGAAFLTAIAPRLVIYQAGENNRYGHPHEQTLRRVRSVTDAEILGTDRHGTIVIEVSGEQGSEISVFTERP